MNTIAPSQSAFRLAILLYMENILYHILVDHKKLLALVASFAEAKKAEYI